MRALLVLTTAAVIGMIAATLQKPQLISESVQDPSKYVYAICMYAYNHIDGQSEQACGEAQERYNVEFICDGVFKGICWVETK